MTAITTYHNPECGTSRNTLAMIRKHAVIWSRMTPKTWHSGGFSVDASVRIEATDRAGLERLLRYCARPAQHAKPGTKRRFWPPQFAAHRLNVEQCQSERWPGLCSNARFCGECTHNNGFHCGGGYLGWHRHRRLYACFCHQRRDQLWRIF